MAEKTLKAVEYMKGPYSCSQSVMCAFADDVGISHDEAKKIAEPYSGGRKIKCGAVCAAEIILSKKFGEDSEKISEFDKKFSEKVGAINCRDIRSKNLRPCIGCVEDSAIILETMI
ncbi:MAG: C_GCAxxG_C_C family protein [Selenomonadaceae bacterium]|nr:C_GCAxxG_C_C family protein [Selenomonadaceae bacterium]